MLSLLVGDDIRATTRTEGVDLTKEVATPWSDIPAGPYDIRLIVTDMDATLLDAEGHIPSGFWDLLKVMTDRGITFVPASGRQYATLEQQFGHVGARVSYIAENGNLVVHEGKPIAVSSVDPQTVQRIIRASRDAAKQRNLGVVFCGLEGAYIERHDQPFVEECSKYFAKLALVDDLMEVDDEALKIAIFDFDDSAAALEGHFQEASRGQQAVLSGKHWIDVMIPDVDKGRGVDQLQAALGVTPEQTAVFGDYLNDLEMLTRAHWSFAMENAHPDLKVTANYLAPSHVDGGVVTVLRRLLGS